jgi:predicted small secreted protein
MTLGIRKLISAGLVGAVLLTASFLLVASWLQGNGVIGWGQDIQGGI